MARTLFARSGSSFGAVMALLVGGAACASPPGVAPPIPSFEAAPCGFTGCAGGLARKEWPHLRLGDREGSPRSAGQRKPSALGLQDGGPRSAEKSPTAPDSDGRRSRTGRSDAHLAKKSDNPLILRLRVDRDVIYFDYRGLDKSEPRLECNVAPVTGATLDKRWQSKLAQYADCRRQMDAAGTDLTAVGATVGAQDVEDIVQALGYRTYDLWGSSYGTFPELYLVARRPAGLRAAIVGVTFPPDTRNIEQFSTFGQGLTAMQRECDRNPACRARFPDMAGSLGRAMERVDREALMGHSRRLTPADLYQALFNMSTDPDSLALVPLAISVAEKGEAKLVAEWIDATKGEDLGIPEVTDPQVAGALATVCSTVSDSRSIEGAAKWAARRYPYLAKAVYPTDAFKRVCEIWKSAPPPRDLLRPIHSDVPVLFYYARLDTAVLVSDTLRVAKGLPNSTVIEVPGVGHNFSDTCLVDLYVAFLDNPTNVLDRSCTASNETYHLRAQRL